MVNHRVEMVYSRYDEPVDFVGHCPWPTTIYNKGAPVEPPGRDVEVVELPNVGLDCHSILHHLAERYADVAEVTLFLCGSWRKRAENVMLPFERYWTRPLLAELPITAGRYHFDDGWPGRVKHWGRWAQMLADGQIRRSPYTLGEWWDRVLGGPRPDRLLYAPGQTFSVPWSAVLHRPRDWYRRLADFFAGDRYPEECHHLERSWVYVFREGGRPDVDL